jgi:hypothetical protein
MSVYLPSAPLRSIKKDVTVRIFCANHYADGCLAIVKRIKKTDAVLELTDGAEIELPITALVAAIDVKPILTDWHEALQLDAQFNYRRAEAMRTARHIEEYRTARLEGAMFPALVREEKDTNAPADTRVIWGEQQPNGFISKSIEVTGEMRRGVPEVSVNWSSCGAVSPERAMAMGTALIEAAKEAQMVRELMENEAGIVVYEV